MTVLPVPSLLFLPVFAELQQAGLITTEECKWLSDPRHVVYVQSGKSHEVLNKTADVLRRHGFERQSNLLAGSKYRPLPMYLWCVVQWSLVI